LPHSEIVVGAPNCDLGGYPLALVGRAWVLSNATLEVGEDPISTLVSQNSKLSLEEGFVLHHALQFVVEDGSEPAGPQIGVLSIRVRAMNSRRNRS